MVSMQQARSGGRFLPKVPPITRNAAELRGARARRLAAAAFCGHPESVVEARPLRARTDCLIRYPSPDGRCGGLVRSPSVFSYITAPSRVRRCLAYGGYAAMTGFDDAGNPMHVPCVSVPITGSIRKGRQSCAEHSSRSLPGPGFSPSRHVATPSANRPFWGGRRGWHLGGYRRQRRHGRACRRGRQCRLLQGLSRPLQVSTPAPSRRRADMT